MRIREIGQVYVFEVKLRLTRKGERKRLEGGSVRFLGPFLIAVV